MLHNCNNSENWEEFRRLSKILPRRMTAKYYYMIGSTNINNKIKLLLMHVFLC